MTRPPFAGSPSEKALAKRVSGNTFRVPFYGEDLLD